MRLSLKALVTAFAATMLFVTPVFATEADFNKEMQYIDNHVTEVEDQIAQYLKTDDGCGAAAKAEHGAHAMEVEKQLQQWVYDEEANYITYLQKDVLNKKETERIKKEILDNYTNLSKVNASYNSMIPAALNDYNLAVADRTMAEANIINTQTAFANYNAQLQVKFLAYRANAIAVDK